MLGSTNREETETFTERCAIDRSEHERYSGRWLLSARALAESTANPGSMRVVRNDIFLAISPASAFRTQFIRSLLQASIHAAVSPNLTAPYAPMAS